MNILATSPLPSSGVPNAWERDQTKKNATRGKIGYLTLAVLGDPQHLRGGNQITIGLNVGEWARSPLH